MFLIPQQTLELKIIVFDEKFITTRLGISITDQYMKHPLQSLVNQFLVFANIIVQFLCTKLHVSVCRPSVKKQCYCHYVIARKLGLAVAIGQYEQAKCPNSYVRTKFS